MDKLSRKYTFAIDAFTPATLSMTRLADYLKELAELLGEKEHVHFDRVKKGSAALACVVDSPAVGKVHERLRAVDTPDAPEELKRHWSGLNQLLAQNQATGQLIEGEKVLIQFPGRTAPQPIGPITQEGELVGKLMRVGGVKGAHALILGSDPHGPYRCSVSEELARRMGHHLYAPIRAWGTGRWYREPEGGWILEEFSVADFEVLPDETLMETIERLQAVEGSGWKDVADPMAELHRIRYGEEPGA